jgi:hypothetical protein
LGESSLVQILTLWLVRQKNTKPESDTVALPDAAIKNRCRGRELHRPHLRPPSTPPGTREGCSVDAVKHARPEHCTPSPSNSHLGKRPKIADQGSYAQVTKDLIRLAVTLDSYPEKKLAKEEMSLIRKMIRGCILSQEGAKAPTFTGLWKKDGALVFACERGNTGLAKPNHRKYKSRGKYPACDAGR